MQTRLYNLWIELRTSFWLVPALMVTTAVAAFLLLLELDREYQSSAFLFLSFLEPIGASGARIILSTIAGSMITVASTVFSITIVTLTLASTQFGPRLLRNFMRSTVTQVVLGSFIATFVYCLCALGSVEPAGRENFVPSLSVNFAVILAIFNVAILIYFIHHVAKSIQVETVIHNINSDLISSIKEYFPEKKNGTHSHSRLPHDAEDSTSVDEESEFIKSKCYGYLQAIDKDALEKLARQHKVNFKLEQRPGVYITSGMPLVSIAKNEFPDAATCDKLRDSFLLGSERTSEQDVEYSIHQMVEIAVRALSPGVNDPYTALACIDYLGSVICRIIDRDFPAEHLLDENKNILITFKTVDFAGIVGAAFDQIRQHSRDHAAVLIHLLDVFHNTISQTENLQQRETLLGHVQMVYQSGMDSMPEELDRQDLQKRFQSITKLIGEKS